MLQVIENTVRILLVYFFIVLWSTVTALKLVWEWCHYKNTSGQGFFSVRHRHKPAVLDEGPWQHRFLQLSKIRMHYVEAGDPTKQLIVMVHGFPEFWYSYRFQLRHFQENYHVVALDLRGYGETDKPTGIANYDVEILAADVAEAIEQLGGKAILIGHDWGAIVCWVVAMNRPDVIADRLVIMNVPHPKAFAQLIKISSAQILKSWYVFMFQTPWLPELRIKANDFSFMENILRDTNSGLINSQNLTDEDMEAWKYTFNLSENSLTAPLNYYRQNAFSAISKKYPKELVQPKTLIIWGERDIALDIKGAELSLPLCRDAKLTKISNASHWVQQDEPQQVNALIEQFIQ